MVRKSLVKFCYEGDEEIEPSPRCFFATPTLKDVANKYAKYVNSEGDFEAVKLLGISKDYYDLCFEKSEELQERFGGGYTEIWQGKLVGENGQTFGVCGIITTWDDLYYALGPE